MIAGGILGWFAQCCGCHAVKRSRLWVFAALVLTLGAGPGNVADARAASAAWTDKTTGVAIGGYDPLTFFTDGRGRKGDQDYEWRWGGVSWRFVNMGNLVQFKRSPKTYAPQFSGYDPMAISLGRLVEGRPAVWEIADGRLYFFHNIVYRKFWSERRENALTEAKKNWPAVLRQMGQTSSDGESDR